MRVRETVRTSQAVRTIVRPTTTGTLQDDVLAILGRSRVNRRVAGDAGKVAELVQRLRGGERVKLGAATYILTP